MAMPGRTWKAREADGYKYGFNGKENDTETSLQDYGFRMYDPMIARFISVDPLFRDYPELTCYQFASNTPIMAIDLDGLEAAGKTYSWGSSNPSLNLSNSEVLSRQTSQESNSPLRTLIFCGKGRGLGGDESKARAIEKSNPQEVKGFYASETTWNYQTAAQNIVSQGSNVHDLKTIVFMGDHGTPSCSSGGCTSNGPKKELESAFSKLPKNSLSGMTIVFFNCFSAFGPTLSLIAQHTGAEVVGNYCHTSSGAGFQEQYPLTCEFPSHVVHEFQGDETYLKLSPSDKLAYLGSLGKNVVFKPDGTSEMRTAGFLNKKGNWQFPEKEFKYGSGENGKINQAIDEACKD